MLSYILHILISKNCRFQHGRADRFEEMIRRDSKKHQRESKGQGASKIDANQHEGLDQTPLQSTEIADETAKTDFVTDKYKAPPGTRNKRSEAIINKSTNDESSKRKSKRKKSLMVEEIAEPPERFPKRLRRAPKENLSTKEKRKEDDDAEIKRITVNQQSSSNSPFRAIRGAGNSFHGWRTDD